LSPVERGTSVNPGGAEPSAVLVPVVAQPNRLKAPVAAIPFSIVRLEITSPIVGSMEGFTGLPSCSSK